MGAAARFLAVGAPSLPRDPGGPAAVPHDVDGGVHRGQVAADHVPGLPVGAVPELTSVLGTLSPNALLALGGVLSSLPTQHLPILRALLTPSRVGADAVLAYYPGNADKYTAEASRIAGPLIVHLAEQDEYIPPDARRQISSALANRPRMQAYSYPGCGHAFARHRGLLYDAEAAALANGRTADFLAVHLQRG